MAIVHLDLVKPIRRTGFEKPPTRRPLLDVLAQQTQRRSDCGQWQLAEIKPWPGSPSCAQHFPFGSRTSKLRTSTTRSPTGISSNPSSSSSLRVSRADGSQSVELQREALPAAGVATGQLYEEQASGKRDHRLASLPASRRSVTSTRSSFADSTGSYATCTISSPPSVTSLRGGRAEGAYWPGAAIDTPTPVKLVFGIFVALAEFERELISEPTIA